MISDDVQFRLTTIHLQRFEAALGSLTASAGTKPTKLQHLEIDAVSAQAEDLRAEIRAYEKLGSARGGGPPT